TKVGIVEGRTLLGAIDAIEPPVRPSEKFVRPPVRISVLLDKDQDLGDTDSAK
ncbi:hypothetical protein P692DRAFT_20748863, partial [Suillus brevipes Sb2]